MTQQETAEVIKQNQVELQESAPPITKRQDFTEKTETQKVNIDDVLLETASKDVTDAPSSEDVADVNPKFHVPVTPDIDSPVKAAVVKTISQDYIPNPVSSVPDMTAPDEGDLAYMGVVEQHGLMAVKPKQEKNEVVFQSALNVQPKMPSLDLTNTIKQSTEEKSGGYRSSLSISPSSRRTMAASFTGSRHVTEKTETSLKTVTSTVQRHVVSSKQSYVSTATIPEHSNNSNVVVSVKPNVARRMGEPFFDQENHAFRASNESTTFTQHAVSSEVHRTVTQANGGDTKTDLSALHLEEKITSRPSASDDKQTVTYKINFQGRPGKEPYTVMKSYSSSEHVPNTGDANGKMSPSGSLLEISTNTVIDEEEEYEQQQEHQPRNTENQQRGDQPIPVRSESPEPDSDTESFMSAKEDVTSDTDTAAYLTAGGSTASLYTDAVSLVDSSAEEASTPVNSDTEVEDGNDETALSDTPESPEENEDDRSRSDTLKGLREQTIILGSEVTSEGELGYRGDSEEGLASSDDLRTAGT